MLITLYCQGIAQSKQVGLADSAKMLILNGVKVGVSGWLA